VITYGGENMNQKKKHQVMMSGTGGRGILMIGRLLAEVGMDHYQHVSYFPNYGAAMRGGSSEVTVTLSDDEISSQAIFIPEVALIMDHSFFAPMEARMQAGGTMFIDSSVVSAKGERDKPTLRRLRRYPSMLWRRRWRRECWAQEGKRCSSLTRRHSIRVLNFWLAPRTSWQRRVTNGQR